MTCSANLLLAQFFEDNTPQTTTESPAETVPSNCPQTDYTTTQPGGPAGPGDELPAALALFAQAAPGAKPC